MPEPTAVSLAAFAAGLSTLTMALFGVDHQSLLYALIGALFARALSEQLGRGRAVLYVVLSMFVGAVLGGLAAAQVVNPPRIVLIAACLVGGLVAHAFATAILKIAPSLTDVAAEGFKGLLRRVFGAKP